MADAVPDPQEQLAEVAGVHAETPADSALPLLVALPAASDGAPPEAAPPPSPSAREVRPFGWAQRDWQRVFALALAAIVALLFLWQAQSVFQSILPSFLLVVCLVALLDRALRVVLLSVVALLFLWLVRPILPPFFIAFILAALLDPTVRYMQSHGHSRVRAILTLYTFGLCLFILFAIVVVPRIVTQVQDLTTNFNTYSANIQKTADSMIHKNARFLSLVGIKEGNLSGILQEKSGPVQASIAATLGSFTLFLQSLLSKIFWLIIIPLATFFFLRDYPILRARLIFLFPETYHERIDIMSREVVDVFGAYLRGLAKICALYAFVAFLLFSLLGLRYALFLGLMAGAFYAVPYVGQLFTATACGSVAYLMDRHTVLFFFHPGANSMAYALAVVVCAVVAQNLFDQLVFPRVVGGSVGLHPVVSIFALMAGATLFGIWGMLFAVPVAASIQILLTYFFPKLTQQPPEHLLEPTPPLA